MEEKRYIGPTVRALSNLIRRNLDGALKLRNIEKLTGIQGMVMGYLYHNRDKKIFQKDIENHFSIRRSSVTNILKLMEKNGTIERKSVENDARLKQIFLTEKSLKRNMAVEEEIEKIESRMAKGLSADEINTFLSVTERIKNNLGE